MTYIFILGGGPAPPLSQLDSLIADILGKENIVFKGCHDCRDSILALEVGTSPLMHDSLEDVRYGILTLR